MKGQLRGALWTGIAVMAVGAAIAASGRAWLRVLIAPAWRTGTLASRSSTPNLLVVLGTLFMLGLAIGHVLFAPIRTNAPGKEGRIVATGLTGLFVAAALELLFYAPISSWLLEAAIAPKVFGPEYVLVLATRLIPGTILFLILATVAVFRARRRPPGPRPVLRVAWLCQFLLLVGSVAWYASPAGPGQ